MSSETRATATSDETLNRLVWERARIGGVFLIVAIVVMFIGELALQHGRRPGIHAAQIANIAVVWLVLVLGRDPSHRTLIRFLVLIGFSATAVATGMVGIFARDAGATLVVLVGVALGTSILVPWGPAYQLAGVVVAIGVGTWALVQIDIREFWLQPIGSVLPTFALSVLVAHLLERQVRAEDQVGRERLARERGLYEANQRLEMEIHSHEDTEKMLRFALLELDHRVKNTLTTLQSIAEQTLETSSSAEDFTDSFRGRIRAMARIHTALAARRWEKVGLRELVDLVVGPYRLNERSVSFPDGDASLSSDEARTLGTALHELATNAAKYGALSTPAGRVDISATVCNADGRRLRLRWTEHGGPPAHAPHHRGLGTKLIEMALAYESGGEVRLDFDESGVRCEIDMPLELDAKKES